MAAQVGGGKGAKGTSHGKGAHLSAKQVMPEGVQDFGERVAESFSW